MREPALTEILMDACLRQDMEWLEAAERGETVPSYAPEPVAEPPMDVPVIVGTHPVL